MDRRRSPVLSLQQGKIQGVIENNVCEDADSYFAFRGIPYAKPPVGQLRFKDPLPAEGWTGIRDASEFGDVCAHLDRTREVIGSDDCLYLNVYTPRIELSAKLPVMLWIHGGGFYLGSGNDDMYGADYIVRKDVVLVTINYRLGVLGFLNLEDPVAPGNQGLKDQVMALRWVRDNIATFGGDPGNVTVFGESAGGAAVHYLTMSPLAEGLFHKAIAQSGTATNAWASLLREPSRYAYQLAASLGFESTDPRAVVDFLRTIDARELVKYQSKLALLEPNLTRFSLFCPGVDNKSENPFLTEPPTIAMKAGVKVPFLLGFNDNEGSFFSATGNMGSGILRKYRESKLKFESFLAETTLEELEKKNITTEEFKSMYFGSSEKPLDEEPYEKISDFFSDIYFLHHIFQVVQVSSETKYSPAYLYKFCYDSPSSFIKAVMNIELPGAPHGEDLSYLFNVKLRNLLQLEPFHPDGKDYKMMEYLVQMWTNFAKTGNPTPAKTELIPVLWEPIEKNSDEYNYLIIDEVPRMESIQKGEQRFEWNTKPKNKL